MDNNQEAIFLRVWVAIAIILIATGIGTIAAFPSDLRPDKWDDIDGDKRDTRQEVLTRDSLGWVCPYTGQIVHDQGMLDVEHIVPFHYAVTHGLQVGKVSEFYNDETNLIMVARSANRSKGDKSPVEWLPPNIFYIPAYLNQWNIVCSKYAIDCPDTTAIHQYFSKFKNGFKPWAIQQN